MYPGTIFNWHDNSSIAVPTTSAVEDGTPLFMQVFSCDKGTEDLIEIAGDDFDAMYGTMDFERHGQSAIQAKNIIDHGGKLYAKRVVADDSTLAYKVLAVKIKAAESPNTGYDLEWQEWTSSDASANIKTLDDVIDKVKAFDFGQSTYPVMVFTDNGRGVSLKSVKVTPDYTTSRTIGNTLYTLNSLEGTQITESRTITFDPEVIIGDTAYRFDKYTCIQISGQVLEDQYNLFLADLAAKLAAIDDTITEDSLRKNDLIFAKTYRGNKIFKTGTDTVILTSNADTVIGADLGVDLEKGSNGNFGDSPVSDDVNSPWAKAIEKVFFDETPNRATDNVFDLAVFDLDAHKIAAIIDANYPDNVKKAIFDLVKFREDCVYFRDYGINYEGYDTFDGISSRYRDFSSDNQLNYFTADYSTFYDIIDPNTKKTITVTMLYDLAGCLVDHIKNNAHAPVAGTINNMILENAIKGTISFVPIVAPSSNQKDAMDQIRVNYAIFQDDQCVVQSCYTSQLAYTQLSFIGNVLAIQEVMRAVRTACPRNRYSLSTGNDLSNYAQAVNNVLNNYLSNFSTLNFIYTQDDLKASQKIFYASIEFAFLNWAQTEIFDIYAINDYE